MDSQQRTLEEQCSRPSEVMAARWLRTGNDRDSHGRARTGDGCQDCRHRSSRQGPLVWFDAPIGYISITRDWVNRGAHRRRERYWKGESTRLIHFLGKDNIVFHCIIFPTMLKLHGDFILPENVPANEFLNLKGLKFSTSRGVAVWLHEFLEKHPPDYLRYAATKVLPERSDSDFSWEGLQAAVNNELADTLGNFVNRTFTFAVKHFEGQVPELNNPNPLDLETLEAMRSFPKRIGQYRKLPFREALDERPWPSRVSGINT